MHDAGPAKSKVIHDKNYQIKSSSNSRIWRPLKCRLFSLCVSFVSALLAINTINPFRILSCYMTSNIGKREMKPNITNVPTTREKCRMTRIWGIENRAALSIIVKICKVLCMNLHLKQILNYILEFMNFYFTRLVFFRDIIEIENLRFFTSDFMS